MRNSGSNGYYAFSVFSPKIFTERIFMENKNKIDKMAEMPVKKLMLVLGVPMIVSMMLQALYNIVDSAFISHMSENGEAALNAVTLAFPVQMLMIAIAIGTGVGVNALLSKNLGEGNEKKVCEVSGNAVFLGIVMLAVFVIFGLFGVGIYIKTQTKDAEIFKMAVSYLKICCVGSVGIVFFSLFEKILQSSGLSLYSTIAQITGALVNIVLDPILIYGLLGIPEMGVAGAAYATVIGQIASFIVAFIFHIKKNRKIKVRLSEIRPRAKTIKEIYAIGLPAIISQALMSFMTYGINIILGRVDGDLVTAYGLYYKIQQFIIFAAFGLRDAITPVVSYAYGMKNKKRVSDGIKYGILYTAVIMLAGTIILEIAAPVVVSSFSLSEKTSILMKSAVYVISSCFVFAGFNISAQGVFQALDSGGESLIISICRQILFVLPTAWIFSGFLSQDLGNSWILWTTFPIAEILSAIIAVLLLRRTVKKVSHKIQT